MTGALPARRRPPCSGVSRAWRMRPPSRGEGKPAARRRDGRYGDVSRRVAAHEAPFDAEEPTTRPVVSVYEEDEWFGGSKGAADADGNPLCSAESHLDDSARRGISTIRGIDRASLPLGEVDGESAVRRVIPGGTRLDDERLEGCMMPCVGGRDRCWRCDPDAVPRYHEISFPDITRFRYDETSLCLLAIEVPFFWVFAVWRGVA